MRTNHKKIAIAVWSLSLCLFILGLYFPIMTSHKKIVLTFDYSETTLWDSIRFFWNGSDYFLAAVIFFFTILFPVFKFFHIGSGLFGWLSSDHKVFWMTRYLADKWSMLDVFIIALVIFHLKMNSQIIVTQMALGTLFLALSILLRMVSSELLSHGIRVKRDNLNN